MSVNIGIEASYCITWIGLPLI